MSELMDVDHLPDLDDEQVELPTLENPASKLTLSHQPRTLLRRERQDYLVDRDSERKKSAEALSRRIDQCAL